MNCSIYTDKEKLEKIIAYTKMSRSKLARALEVSYKTVYRWLDQGIKPHNAQSNDIDRLFKEHVDLRELAAKLKSELRNPIKILKNNDALRQKFFLEMTYHSNAIEGGRLTLKETASALNGEWVKGKEFFEVLEAVNHKNALNFMFEAIKPGFKINENYILKLHSIVMYNFSDKLPGKYRTGNVSVTNSERKLPPAKTVPKMMRKLTAHLNKYGPDPIGKAASVHYEFESIHPFFDGSGRVGRLILITQLLSQGYPPAIIQIEDHNKYYTALNKADMSDFRDLMQMICDSIVKGYSLIKGEQKRVDIA